MVVRSLHVVQTYEADESTLISLFVLFTLTYVNCHQAKLDNHLTFDWIESWKKYIYRDKR